MKYKASSMARNFSPLDQPPITNRPLGPGIGDKLANIHVLITIAAIILIATISINLWKKPQNHPIPSLQKRIFLLKRPIRKIVDYHTIQIMKEPPGLTLSSVNIVECKGSGVGKIPIEICDHLPYFEDAFVRAVKASQPCTPNTQTDITVPYILSIDFTKKRLNIYISKDSEIKKNLTKDLVRCMKKSIQKPEWKTLSHQYKTYKLFLKVTYPGVEKKL